MLLSLDPGQNSPGVALFGASGLVAAARIALPGATRSMPAGARWLQVARFIVGWAQAGTGRAYIDAVAFEKPQWYQRTKSKGDPNDLVGCAGVAANVTGLLNVSDVISPEPATWIGQLSKVCPTCKGKAKKKCTDCRGSAWETPRGRYIRKRLSADELALVPDQNDAIDSVGIGLWALGRLKPHTVFSNGRDGR